MRKNLRVARKASSSPSKASKLVVRQPIAYRETVFVVDDDPSALRSLARLIRSVGYSALTFDQPSALLASEIPAANACILIDIELPEMNGFQLYQKLAESGRRLPVIMITGREPLEILRVVEKIGIPVLFKPIDERILLKAIKRALAFWNTRPG
jgi:FixJ family two-component response regulator